MSKKCESEKKNQKRQAEGPGMLTGDPPHCISNENKKSPRKDPMQKKTCTKTMDPKLLSVDPIKCKPSTKKGGPLVLKKTCSKIRDKDELPGNPPHCLPDENDIGEDIKCPSSTVATSNSRTCKLDPCRLDTASRRFKCDDKCTK